MLKSLKKAKSLPYILKIWNGSLALSRLTSFVCKKLCPMLAFRIRDPLWHASAMSPGSKLKRAKKSQIKKNLTFLGHLACSDVTIGNARVHGLRTPNEAFFHWNPELLGLSRQIRLINSGAFRVFLSKLSAPILVQWVPCPCFPLFNHYFYNKLSLYTHIPNIYLRLGRKE